MNARLKRRSDKVIDSAWAAIRESHHQYGTVLVVVAEPRGRDTLVTVQAANTAALSKLVTTYPELRPTFEAAHRPDLVRLVYIDGPTSETRVLALPLLDD